GPLGAEIDAAMDAVSAALAIVLPAIPDVGRTTVGGRQLIDGVPVHETAFARDPQNPIAESRVEVAIGATSRRRAGGVSLGDVRGARIVEGIARCRADGAAIVVGDAETDADLDRWIAALGAFEEPLVLVGSTGLAKACRGLPPGWLPRSAAERRPTRPVCGEASAGGVDGSGGAPPRGHPEPPPPRGAAAGSAPTEHGEAPAARLDVG